MAFITADRVKDTSTTTGTGSFTVSGSAPLGYQTFSSVLASGDTFYYCIQNQGSTEWEVGVGTYSGSNQFARTTVLSSSDSGSKVAFSSGIKNVFLTLAAARTVEIDSSGVVTIGNLHLTNALSAAYGGTGLTAPGASGNVLTSNGTAWVSQAGGGGGGSGTVTSVNVSGGTTGLTATGGPVTTSGTITLGGTLAIANGGTNGTATPTAGTIAYGTGTALAYSTVGTSGQVLVSGGTGAPTWSTISGTGTVTSVAQSFTGGLISVSGSPITGAGTLALTVAGTSGGVPYFSSSSAWASSAVLTASAITTANAAATGTASFYRLLKSDGTTVIEQGTVGTSGADLNLNTTSIVSGGPVAVSSKTFTEGNA
jgi:hypothetical protein